MHLYGVSISCIRMQAPRQGFLRSPDIHSLVNCAFGFTEGGRLVNTKMESTGPSLDESPDPRRAGADSGTGPRKLRKGTRSCWECKRRKMRCSFSPPSDSACLACRRRGSKCVSQEQPEEASAPDHRDRIVRVEALVQQLASQVGFVTREDPGPASSAPTGPSATPAQWTTNDKNTAISASLHAALPPREDVQLIINAGLDVSLHKLFTHPYPVLAHEFRGGQGALAKTPPATAHPVLLAKYLLSLATCLQYLHPEIHADEMRRLSEQPRQLMRRLADAAIATVTRNDRLLDSIEALECIMLESMFEANSGHLRRAWLACRRAMLVAQMMGLHRAGAFQALNTVDASQPVYPGYFWFRIVCTDRQLCLMLGLPQGSLDVSMASEAALAGDTPEGRFERKQSVIASQILERNDAMEDVESLQRLDAELQGAADEMPSKWWLVPNLASVVRDAEQTFWETIRLFDQMFYFNLLNMLHLPYMLRPHTGGHDHSKLASTNASRELLTRFIMLRSFNRVAFSCRPVDFFALVAGMTLLIAHLDGHRQQPGVNVLAHQRHGDRAMIERALESMDGVAKLNTDVLSERASSLLKRLLAFETDAALGKMPQQSSTIDQITSPVTHDEESLGIHIPYLGTVKISRQGVVSIEGLERHHVPTETSISRPSVPTEMGLTGPSVYSQQGEPARPCSSTSQLHEPEPEPSPQSRAIDDALQEQHTYPGLTAAVDDWAFQGVDMAFFDNLTRRSEAQDFTHNGNWVNWDEV